MSQRSYKGQKATFVKETAKRVAAKDIAISLGRQVNIDKRFLAIPSQRLKLSDSRALKEVTTPYSTC